MMTPREFVEAYFQASPDARKIEQALIAADEGDERAAWALASPIAVKENADNRQAISDAVYSRLSAAAGRRKAAQ